MRRRDIRSRLMEHFLRNPTAQHRVRELSRSLGLPLPSVIRYARELVEEGILRRREVAGVTAFSADRSSDAYLLEKRLHNLRSLYASGLVEHLRREHGNPTVVLFGSYARGEDVESSDIDLYVETPVREVAGLEGFEEALGHRLHLIVHPSIDRVENPELANNILNGVVLNGFMEVFR